MMNVTVQMVVYCVILVLLAIPLGSYMGKVMNGEHVFLSGVLQPVERVIYRVLKIDPEEDMDWKKYSVCAGVFSVLSLFVLWAILCFQKFLPLNPEGIEGTSWHQYQLAGLLRRIHPELFQPDAGTEFPELCFGSNRDCGPVCPDQGICKGKENRHRKLLYGYDKDRALHTDSPVNGGVPYHCVTGSAADL